MSSFRNDRGGFSIVEILVALTILIFGVYGVYAQFINTGKQGRERLAPIQARFLAHQELEQLRACPYRSLKQWKPAQAPPNYPDQPSFIYQDSVTARPDGLLELTVQVGWDMRPGEHFSRERSITVKGYKAP